MQDLNLHLRLMSLLGIVVMLGIAIVLSRARGRVNWRLVGWGLALQLFFAVIILLTPIGRPFFAAMNEVFLFLGSMGKEGARFLVGDLVDQNFLWGVLPTIIVYAGVAAVLYHIGLMQKIVYGVAWIMQRTMGTSGAESIAAASNVFIGQTEAPLVIKPFLAKMTTSETMALMSGGLATVAGGVMAACVTMLSDKIPNIAGHMMAASIMSAPAAIIFAKLLFPETETPVTQGISGAMESLDKETKGKSYNALDAYVSGAGDGVNMVIMIAAMLIAFVGAVWGINEIWGHSCIYLGGVFGFDATGFDTLQEAGAVVFWPFAHLMGIPPVDTFEASKFLAEKTLINEFVAYGHLAEMMADPTAHQFDPRTKIILTYALCGFSNILSLGIQIAGISTLVPELRGRLCRLAPWALLAGTFACFQTACFAGLLL